MYTTYHLTSAQELNSDILESIKTAFKSKPITIIVEEDLNDDFELSDQMKAVLDERLIEDDKDYLSSEQSIQKLSSKYGV
jgi:hypothetical protein